MATNGKQSVLIVDDVETDLDTLVDALADDYDVAVAMDGPTALEMATSQPPDLILLDILMQGMDGYEVCRRLKASPATAAVPVIFLTALTETHDKINGFALGAVDYITKPFDTLEVKARVKTHISLKIAIACLEKQNRELAEAARLREDVESITHHDLKGPLNAIITLPKLLLMAENLSGEQREYIEIIEDSGYKMLNIVNLSLSLLKMEHNRYEASPENVDILQVLRKVLIELSTLHKTKALRMELVLDGVVTEQKEGFDILGEELLCYSMLSNLIKNAFEHSPHAGTVRISLATGEPCVIRIRNAGETPLEFQHRFFEKYATFGKSGGTGLGTYSARLMARTMGGNLRLDTAEPGHTTLEIELPPPVR